MQIRTIAALLVMTLAPVISQAAPSSPPPEILKLTSAVIHATNTDDPSALAGLFTDDAVVVDENPPFAWRGAGAGVAWWHVVQKIIQKERLVHLQATNLRTGEFKQSTTDAYLVQSMTITATTPGKPLSEAGTLTYTFHKTGSTWLISTMVWTTKPANY